MPKFFNLQVGKDEIPTSKLTYDNLITLFKQFIDKNNTIPKIDDCCVENNLPSYSKVKKILENKGITFKEFCSKLGYNRMLLVNGIHKMPKDITYKDLVLLYKEYIDKYHVAPTSKTSTIENNLPHRVIINSILKENNLTHDKFLSFFGIMNNKRKYKPVNVGDLFGRWKVIEKGKSRSSSKNKNMPFWICECTCGSNIKREISENALQTGNSKSCGCLQLESIQKLKGTFRKQSFEDWCIENEHRDFLNRWDYDKNKVNPSEVSYISHSKFYFKCPCNKHDSSLYQLSSLYYMNELRCKFCNSFAQRFIDARGEHALEKYWDYDKNTVDPWDIPGSSSQKIWLKCTDTDYHGSYEITRDSAINGHGCSYCNHTKIHPKDSFGQMMINKYGKENFNKIWNIEKNTIDPFTIPPSTRSCKVWLNCLDVSYHPPTLAYPNDIKNHSGFCHYCAKTEVCKEDSLGYNYPEVLDIWSDKNSKSPFEYFPSSNFYVWWKCYYGKHNDFKRKIIDAKVGEFGCPKCSQESMTSKLQNKVCEYITKKYNYLMLYENNCTLKPRNPMTIRY